MRARLFLYGLTVLVLASSFAVFMSGYLLKQPMVGGDDVGGQMAALRMHIEAGDWAQAAQAVNALEQAWRKVLPRIQFGVEVTDTRDFGLLLRRIREEVRLRDAVGALVDLAELRGVWDDMGR